MNGMVEVTTTTFLSTATYSCNEGRSLVASSGEMVASSSIITTCQADGVWSVGEPTCIGEPSLLLCCIIVTYSQSPASYCYVAPVQLLLLLLLLLFAYS